MSMRRSACALLVLGAALTGGSPARADDEVSVESGRRAYTSFCARCHGLNLVRTGGAAFDLRRFPADAKDRFLRSVNQGLREMPAWAGVARPAQIESIWLYIGSVNGWPAAPASAASAVASSQAQ
jgi:mono/diheme cytochrome c family protein